MSGLTSQPALNSIVAALENTPRDTKIVLDDVQKISDYWAAVRPVYNQFESDLKSSTAEIYKYELPGGQYSNLKPQVESFGLEHKFKEVKEMYKTVNIMLGDIIKVTPSSKVVGDMAIFMVQNDLTSKNIYEKGKNMAFPDSVVSFFKGMIGQPMGGFPEKLQKLVLKGEDSITCRPGELLEPVDFEKVEIYLKDKFGRNFSNQEVLSYTLYPKVFEEYLNYIKKYSDLSQMGSDVFFHGLAEGETSEIKISKGKRLIVKLLEIGKLDNEGNRTVAFEVNGNRREIQIHDEATHTNNETSFTKMADPSNEMEIGSSIPGTVTKLLVSEGDTVKEGQTLAIVEAMKMETNITSPSSGVVESIVVKENQQIKSSELLMKLK